MFDEILNKIDDVVWGIPTIALILITGIVMTIAARGIQFTKLGRAFKQIFKKNVVFGILFQSFKNNTFPQFGIAFA